MIEKIKRIKFLHNKGVKQYIAKVSINIFVEKGHDYFLVTFQPIIFQKTN